MRLSVEWSRPIRLRDARKDGMVYAIDLEKLPRRSGVYIFGRRWGAQFEALYVGKATNIRNRVKSHFNNLRLMHHLDNAKSGTRVVLAGTMIGRPGQRAQKSITLTERALIRYFLSEGHDLVNKQGTRLRRHELESSGHHPKRWFPRTMYLEKANGE